jgi:hypothetical protein
MSTNLGPALPDALITLFSGDNLRDKIGFAAVLVTPSAADSYPHPAIVTPGEMVAGDPQTLRVALYENSTASRNLQANRAGTIALAHEGAAYYVKFDAEPYQASGPEFAGQAVFTFRTRHVLKDAEEGAEVTSGFRFKDLAGDDALLGRWEPMVGALRRTFASG